jgi:hypothetical protein
MCTVHFVEICADVGTEVKQHGSSFFSSHTIKAHCLPGLQTSTPGSTWADSRALSAEFADERVNNDSALTESPRNGALDSPHAIDAADTEYLLLGTSMIWDPSHVSSPDPSEPFAKDPPNNANVSGSWPFVRAVASKHVEAERGDTVMDMFSSQRLPVGTSSAASIKRTRSGLSSYLPSLVEHDAAEAACALWHPSDSMSGSAHSHERRSCRGGNSCAALPFSSASASVPGCSLPGEVSEETAARPVPLDGPYASHFSSSSPGEPLRAMVAHQLGTPSGLWHSSGSSRGAPGKAIVHALDRSGGAETLLGLVRTAMCKAAFGQGLSHLVAPDNISAAVSGCCSPSRSYLRPNERLSTVGASANVDIPSRSFDTQMSVPAHDSLPCQPSAGTSHTATDDDETKRHGSQALMTLLELSHSDSRHEWLQLMSLQRLHATTRPPSASSVLLFPLSPHCRPEALNACTVLHLSDNCTAWVGTYDSNNHSNSILCHSLPEQS